MNGDDGFIFKIKFRVKNVLFKLGSGRSGEDLQRKIVGELQTDGFDFG
jgi:hypothetical protein